MSSARVDWPPRHRDDPERYADYALNEREVEMADRAFGDRTRE